MFYSDVADTRCNFLKVKEDGFIVDPSIWTREFAEHFARKDGLTLTQEHWQIINYLRSYFEKYEIAPMMKILAREIGTMGTDKGGVPYLFQLFPEGPAKQACRYAGLPRATGCI